MKSGFDNVIEQVVSRNPRYKSGAYEFVMEALHFTQKSLQRERHVTGEELLEGLRDFAVKKFGPMAATVLGHWGVETSEDFGRIVFHMVESGPLAKEERDPFESFRNGFDFREAFTKGYRRDLEKEIGRIK